jgi:hypothetical protein
MVMEKAKPQEEGWDFGQIFGDVANYISEAAGRAWDS